MEVNVMPKDERDILEVLRAELDQIEKGGYGRSVRTPWKPTSTFQDSLTCINFGYPYRAHPCDECFLNDLVPPGRRSEVVPCHHIPLKDRKSTRLNSSHLVISYAVFCLKKKKRGTSAALEDEGRAVGPCLQRDRRAAS